MSHIGREPIPPPKKPTLTGGVAYIVAYAPLRDNILSCSPCNKFFFDNMKFSITDLACLFGLIGVATAATTIERRASCMLTIVTESDFGTGEGNGDMITVKGMCQSTRSGASGCISGQGRIEVDVDGITGTVNVNSGDCPAGQLCCITLS